MRRVFISEPLEVLASVLLVAAAATVGVVFHRAALSVLLGLTASATLIVYFAQVYQDVHVSLPRLPRRRGRSLPPAPEPAPGQTVRVCGVCDRGPGVDHSECNKVVARTAATMRRPRDP